MKDGLEARLKETFRVLETECFVDYRIQNFERVLEEAEKEAVSCGECKQLYETYKAKYEDLKKQALLWEG